MPLSATLCSWTQSLPAAPAQLPTVSQASFGVGDTLLIVVVALIVFGPKKLPEISKQIGKLLYEFRKASNDFKFQIEEELRSAEQAERQKLLQSQAATPQPATPIAIASGETVSAEPAEGTEAAKNATEGTTLEAASPAIESSPETAAVEPAAATGPRIEPPATGLPVSSRSPYRATENVEGATALPAAGESLDEMQADAQEAVRAAAADPSYNQAAETATSQPIPTHHG